MVFWSSDCLCITGPVSILTVFYIMSITKLLYLCWSFGPLIGDILLNQTIDYWTLSRV